MHTFKIYIQNLNISALLLSKLNWVFKWGCSSALGRQLHKEHGLCCVCGLQARSHSSYPAASLLMARDESRGHVFSRGGAQVEK